MFLKKSKFLIYIFICLFILSLITPVYSFGINKDSIYVWSNNSDSIPTVSTTEEGTAESSQNNSR